MPRRRWAIVPVVAVGGLVFQIVHLSEHTVQMAAWVRYPQRAPFMSPLAHAASEWLGQVDPGRSSETTLAVARGMEYLHLVGNMIFLGGIVALWFLARDHDEARRRTGYALVIQGLHVVEHVVLVATLVIVGRPLGFSTLFGLLDGTRLSTYRVWWHGSVNLLATVVCATAVHALWTARRRQRVAPPVRHLRAGVAVTMAVPIILALAIGRPIGPTSAAHEHGEVGVDDVIDDVVGFHLVDVAAEVGLDVRHSAFRWDVTMDPVAMMGGGVCWIDVDRDGWLDLFITDTWSDGEWGLWNSAAALPTTRLFRNVDGRFEEYTDAWSAGLEARANGCVAADFDGDGFTDLYVTTSRDNLLLWNTDGEGFVEGADAAGVDAYGWHTGAAAGDIDGDGWIDLVVAGYADLNTSIPDASTGFPNNFAPIRDLVFLNRGPRDDGRPVFDEVSAQMGMEPHGAEYGLGVVLTDVDADGDLDAYVANDTQPNRLYLTEQRSDGSVTFAEVGAQSGADDPNSGMGIATGDTNGDSLPDLVVTNLAGQGHASLLSAAPSEDRVPSFDAPADAVFDQGLEATGWGASFGDLDRDGALDLLIASGAIPITSLSASSEVVTFFCGLGDPAGAFEPATDRVALDRLDARNGRAVALADYDNDGDLDAVVTAIGQHLALLENRGADGQSITVDPGTPAPGLHVRVDFDDGTTIERTAVVGGSWLSSEDPRIQVGFGPDRTIERVTTTMPGAEPETVLGVAAGTTLTVRR